MVFSLINYIVSYHIKISQYTLEKSKELRTSTKSPFKPCRPIFISLYHILLQVTHKFTNIWLFSRYFIKIFRRPFCCLLYWFCQLFFSHYSFWIKVSTKIKLLFLDFLTFYLIFLDFPQCHIDKKVIKYDVENIEFTIIHMYFFQN